ncbi:MAG: hypothetical protein OXC94_00325 [Chloroflexi bacterium]|nr:hypothetical protein [Chloroflexota bacterium]
MRARGTLAAAALAGALLLFAPAPAGAEPGGGYDPDPGAPQTTTEVEVVSGPDGVTIYIETQQVTPGTPGSPGGSPGGGESAPPDCHAAPVNVGHLSTEWVQEGLAANPGTHPWGVSCDDGSFGIAWVPTGGGAPEVVSAEPPLPPIDPRVVRDAVFRIVPLPEIAVGVSPAVGLVALESWFWVDGYGGGTVSGSATLGRYDVAVELTAVRYAWSWGDGSALTTASRGLPFPQRSPIRHTYERSSLREGGSYPVGLQVTWEARYSDNGRPWLPLDPIVSSHQRSYPVRQLQSVLTTSE